MRWYVAREFPVVEAWCSTTRRRSKFFRWNNRAFGEAWWRRQAGARLDFTHGVPLLQGARVANVAFVCGEWGTWHGSAARRPLFCVDTNQRPWALSCFWAGTNPRATPFYSPADLPKKFSCCGSGVGRRFFGVFRPFPRDLWGNRPPRLHQFSPSGPSRSPARGSIRGDGGLMRPCLPMAFLCCGSGVRVFGRFSVVFARSGGKSPPRLRQAATRRPTRGPPEVPSGVTAG